MIPDNYKTMSKIEPPNNRQAGYEASDAHIAPIWFSALGMLIGIAIVITTVTLLFDHLHYRDLADQHRTDAERVTDAIARTATQFPEPRLQVAPQIDLAALRTREDTELNTYGWIDRKTGVVRLPIERAMDLVAQKGLPVRGAPNAPKAHLTPLDMQQARPQQREPAKENR
jgi:hypothetical protein